MQSILQRREQFILTAILTLVLSITNANHILYTGLQWALILVLPLTEYQHTLSIYYSQHKVIYNFTLNILNQDSEWINFRAEEIIVPPELKVCQRNIPLIWNKPFFHTTILLTVCIFNHMGITSMQQVMQQVISVANKIFFPTNDI